MKATPSSDCTKNCNNCASFVSGGSFMTGSPCDMKYVMCLFEFLVSLDILKFDILKLGEIVHT